MTLKELKKVTEEKNVRNLIVNGFRFEHSKGNYAKLIGCIPLSLARKLSSNDYYNEMLGIMVHNSKPSCSPDDFAKNEELNDLLSDMKDSGLFDEDDLKHMRKTFISNLEQENRIDELYVTEYRIDTTKGVAYAIDCITNGDYHNVCMF